MIQRFDIQAAAERIAPYAIRTPVKISAALNALTGASLFFKCENLQHGGAFKFRGAVNAVFALDDAIAVHGVATHSSGNHGAALARAAKLRGITAHVVVPVGSVPSKVRATKSAGASMYECANNQAAREAMTEHVIMQTGASLVHPFENPWVMAGQGTACLELMADAQNLDIVLAPVGGGGLMAGTAVALSNTSVQLYGVEPEGAADTAASLLSGQRITQHVPNTICDGLRTLVGVPNFEIIRQSVKQVLVVSDAQCIAAQELVSEHLEMLIEPSSATVLAAVLTHPDIFAGKRVGLMVTGGNV